MTENKDGTVDVTILMPCLNEIRSLPICIEWARDALKELRKHGLTGEILISDNGSTDGSQKFAQSKGCRVISCNNKGYGSALIYGCRQSKGTYILMGDADASYDFREGIPMVLKLVEGYDLCIGSRFKGRIMPNAMPWKNRYIGNPILSGILNLLYNSGVSDAHCGLRAFTKKAFNKMRLRFPGMEFASEMVVRASQLDLKRVEVPITLFPDRRGRPPHLRPWQDGKRHLKFLIMYAPLWIFFAPSALLLIFSVLIFATVLSTPVHDSFRFGRIHFGDHWLILAGGFFSIGIQGMLSGLAALIYRVGQRLLPISPFLKWVYRKASFTNSISIGSLFLLTGFAVILYIIFQWGITGFGALYRIREMVIASTCIVVGLQFYFSTLLLTVLDILRSRRGS